MFSYFCSHKFFTKFECLNSQADGSWGLLCHFGGCHVSRPGSGVGNRSTFSFHHKFFAIFCLQLVGCQPRSFSKDLQKTLRLSSAFHMTFCFHKVGCMFHLSDESQQCVEFMQNKATSTLFSTFQS